jgi:hypothetical protein
MKEAMLMAYAAVNKGIEELGKVIRTSCEHDFEDMERSCKKIDENRIHIIESFKLRHKQNASLSVKTK